MIRTLFYKRNKIRLESEKNSSLLLVSIPRILSGKESDESDIDCIICTSFGCFLFYYKKRLTCASKIK